MSYAKPLLDTYPRTFNVDAGVLAATIDALNDCAQACTADADDDLSEQNVTEMVKCIRLCLDCADVCTATVGVTSRQTDYDANVTRPLLEACVATCKSCGDSASGMPRFTSTAAFAGRPAAFAGRPAGSSWTPRNRRPAIPAAVQAFASTTLESLEKKHVPSTTGRTRPPEPDPGEGGHVLRR